MIYVNSDQLEVTIQAIAPTKICGGPKLPRDMPTEPNWRWTQLPLSIEKSEAADKIQQLLGNTTRLQKSQKKWQRNAEEASGASLMDET